MLRVLTLTRPDLTRDYNDDVIGRSIFQERGKNDDFDIDTDMSLTDNNDNDSMICAFDDMCELFYGKTNTV